MSLYHELQASSNSCLYSARLFQPVTRAKVGSSTKLGLYFVVYKVTSLIQRLRQVQENGGVAQTGLFLVLWSILLCSDDGGFDTPWSLASGIILLSGNTTDHSRRITAVDGMAAIDTVVLWPICKWVYLRSI